MTPVSAGPEASIPEDKREAVDRALIAAFGSPKLDDLAQITKGRTTSLVYRIVVGGAAYLLKIITRNEDPTRHYNCMAAAAKCGFAPAIRYTSTADRVSITDFVAATPLSLDIARSRMSAVLRTLHDLPAFTPAPFNTTCTYLFAERPFAIGPSVADFLQRFRASNILPVALCDELFAIHAQLAAAYPRNDAPVSCHNDLFKPDNILFDGARVWLVDWEAACANDRYSDLAVVANQVVASDAEEINFLAEYFDAPPNEYQLARLHLMRQAAHLFYAMAFLQFGSMGEPIDWSLPVPEYDDLRHRLWSGEADLVDRASKVTYGRVQLERLLANAREDRYRESLRIAENRRAAQ